jgi:sulfur carrier protein
VIDVTLNGEQQRLDDGTTVDQVVAWLDRGPAGVAVAINGDVVPRSRWAATSLCADDRVEVLAAAQGG